MGPRVDAFLRKVAALRFRSIGFEITLEAELFILFASYKLVRTYVLFYSYNKYNLKQHSCFIIDVRSRSEVHTFDLPDRFPGP